MSIRSHAFGRVELTGADARKFTNQVKFGKPKSAAKTNVRKGAVLIRKMAKGGNTAKIRLG